MLTRQHRYPAMTKKVLVSLLLVCALTDGQTTASSEHRIASSDSRMLSL